MNNADGGYFVAEWRQSAIPLTRGRSAKKTGQVWTRLYHQRANRTSAQFEEYGKKPAAAEARATGWELPLGDYDNDGFEDL